jgi:hypothetical protein
MNDNQKPKNLSALSEQLSEIFDHMDYIDSSFSRIESYAKKKFDEIEKEINLNNDHDISRVGRCTEQINVSSCQTARS